MKKFKLSKVFSNIENYCSKIYLIQNGRVFVLEPEHYYPNAEAAGNYDKNVWTLRVNPYDITHIKQKNDYCYRYLHRRHKYGLIKVPRNLAIKFHPLNCSMPHNRLLLVIKKEFLNG